ncbi:TPA: glycoside hydrolase family 75 protein [Pseudomonas aeruginosa]|nr:hypothetical protein [Pseudomonas aeruginosa]MBG4200011.1 hypothetical protein [Pseudomonas aeruginosa]
MAHILKNKWKLGSSNTEEEPSVVALESGRILIIADASTDADGAPDAKKIDRTGSEKTSLSKSNGWQGAGDYVNAREIPYFVLPKNWEKITGISCKLGDLAKISYQGKFIFAIYADVGPEESIGEASISAVEALDFNPWNKDNTKIISGIPYGVSYEIAPGSRNLLFTRTFEEIQHYGKIVFNEEPVAESPMLNGVEWIGISKGSGEGIIFSAHTEKEAIITLKTNNSATLIQFLERAPSVPLKAVQPEEIGLLEENRNSDIISSLISPVSNADKFITFFNLNYAAVRQEVEDWFVPEYSPRAAQNGCVAHQVSCLKLCSLPYPDWNSKKTIMQAINVDYFVGWALSNNWKRITDMAALLPGDICVSGPRSNLPSLDHVYAFYQYIDGSTALVLHNQAFGLSRRSLVGRGGVGTWRFALRMP